MAIKFNDWDIFASKGGNIYSVDQNNKWKYYDGYGRGTGPYFTNCLNGEEILKLLVFNNQLLIIGEYGRISSMNTEKILTNYNGIGGTGFYFKVERQFNKITDAVIFNNRYLILSTEEGEIFSYDGQTVWDHNNPEEGWEFANGTGFGNGIKNNKTAIDFKRINSMTVTGNVPNQTLIIAGNEGRLASYNNEIWYNFDTPGIGLYNNGLSFNYENIITVLYNTSSARYFVITEKSSIYRLDVNWSPMPKSLALGEAKTTKSIIYDNRIIIAGEMGRIACFFEGEWTNYDGTKTGDVLQPYYSSILSNIKDLYIFKEELCAMDDETGILYNFWINKWVYDFIHPPKDIGEVKTIPTEGYIEFSWDMFTQPRTWENPVSYYIEFTKDSNIKNFSVKSNNFKYVFDRDEDGYPEIDEIAEWKIKIKAFNSHGAISMNYNTNYENGIVNLEDDFLVANYGTWDVTKINNINLKAGTGGRNVVLTWDKPGVNPDISQPHFVKLNGSYYYNIQISENMVGNWYQPGTTKNEYIDDSAWRENTPLDSFAISNGERFAHSVPLIGQNGSGPVITKYDYRIRVISKQPTSIVNTEFNSSWTNIITATATPVSARDIVTTATATSDLPSLTTKNIIVENLAALNANLGVISDGSLGLGDGLYSPWNYWILNNVNDIYSGTNLGDFRVGDGNVGLQIKPKSTGDQETIRLGSFTSGKSFISINANGDMQIKAQLLDVNANKSILDSALLVKGSFEAQGFFKNDVMRIDPDNTKDAYGTPVKRDYDNTYQDGSRKLIVMSNTDAETKRNHGLDIGIELLESDKVFHFDGSLLGYNKNGPLGSSFWSNSAGTFSFDPQTIVCDVLPFSDMKNCLKTSNTIFTSPIQTNMSGNWVWEGWVKPDDVSNIGPNGIRLLTISTNSDGTGDIAEFRINAFLHEYVNNSIGVGYTTDAYVKKPQISQTIEANFKKSGDIRNVIVDPSATLAGWNHIAILHSQTENKLYFIINNNHTEMSNVNLSASNYYINLNLDGRMMYFEEVMNRVNISNFPAYVTKIKQNTIDKLPFGSIDYTKKQVIIDSIEPILVANLTATGNIRANKVYNAVYNDIVDCIEIADGTEVEYGKAYTYKAIKSQKRCQDCIGIASDTYGFCLGGDVKKNQMPIAIGGFVLAHTPIYPEGTPLVSNENGTLIKASFLEKLFYSHRIIAIFYKVEKEKQWNDIQVNERHWVKVK